MATLVYCRGCGDDLDASAISCPHCGALQRYSPPKSKVFASLLAIFLGGFGFHRFYLGQWWGLFYLLFCWTGLPFIVGFIEGIVFLCVNGSTWDAKYGGVEY
ncbi:TM2 domain-containing protein [Pseudohongiella nitratireducens]|uniref:TM2 domain-containing protein n=1 Tax=Pseudohongiella nitratireducens TaxID=1768907 RepID=UPI0030EF2F39